MVESFFKPEELLPGIESINGLVDQLAQKLFAAGKIRSK